MRTGIIHRILPSWQSASLAVVASVLLILAFPDFEYWFLAWFAMAPLMWAVDREKESAVRCFLLGWLFGFLFFSGTCWWLTYAPIHYAGFPWPLAYFLLFCVTGVASLFPALFAAILAILLRRFGSWGFLAAPFVWVFTEFLRYWLTGNNWNAIGYSQALSLGISELASIGGVLAVSFASVVLNLGVLYVLLKRNWWSVLVSAGSWLAVAAVTVFVLSAGVLTIFNPEHQSVQMAVSWIVAVQPNVPMSDLDQSKWKLLRQRQIDMAEATITKARETNTELPILVVLPESPMNFMYEDDREFSSYINDFARRNDVSVLFNSAEPDISTGKYFNSAVLVGSDGRKAAEYDKIFLLPFGEAVPGPFAGFVPAFVGTFAYGNNYSLIPVTDAKAGVMICFESHFGQLSREYARNGADFLIEMTNDGYLGPTPVLRQHLANAAMRSTETSLPVIRVTNVGITGNVFRFVISDKIEPYTEGVRLWSVAKSHGSQTFYVKYGDWFAWLCTLITIGLLIFGIATRKSSPTGTNNMA